MTAWQDQPPRSRRQLRLNERDDVHDDGAQGTRPQDSHVDVAESVEPSAMEHPTLSGSMVGQQAIQPLRDTFARPGWEASARSAAATPELPAPAAHQPRSRAEAAIASGRRSQHSFPHAVPAEQHKDDRQEFPRPATSRPSAAAAEAPSAEPQPLSAEPLNYFTQGRSQVPAYGGPSFGVNAVTPPPVDPAGAGASEEVSGGYRIRDFSPESRRNAFSSTAEPSAASWDQSSSTGGHLDYYTQQGGGKQAAADQPPAEHSPVEHLPADHAAASSAATGHAVDHAAVDQSSSVAGQPATDTHTTSQEAPEEPHAEQTHAEHTMTRRELRALREASALEAAGPAPLVAPQQQAPVTQAPATRTPVTQAPVPLRSPLAPAPQSSRELSDAMAEFDALMARESGAVSLPEVHTEDAPSSALQPSTGPVSGAAGAEDAAHDESGQSDSGVEFFDALLGGERNVEAQPVWPLAAELPTSELKSAEQLRPVEQAQPVGQAGIVEQPGIAESVDRSADIDHHYVAPVGHWSRQAATDEGEVDGITLSRNIGATSGAVTANHLVISSVPTVNDLLKPFSPTGEIMITGTIDLPRSLGTTGAHPARYDHSDVDTLLEASDREDSNVDSAPVRAIRAVSTHTSSRGLIGAGKPPRSSRLPMILAVSTAAVAAVVVVLFVAGIVLRVF